MTRRPDWAAIGAALGAGSGNISPTPVTGGWRLVTGAGPVFLKTLPADAADRLAAEAEGLEALAAARLIAVPKVIGRGTTAGCAWLALEWLEFVADSAKSQARLGAALAEQHRVIGRAFGWGRDNYIGGSPQENGWHEDWTAFWRERRLKPQLEWLKADEPRLYGSGLRLLEKLGALLAGHRPQPSLLHGDLWAGNRGTLKGDRPVLFDPAVYFGDRESDLAMTRLFGGFDPDFYSAYASTWPLAEGARERVELYNLYHLLNHANLFGGGYAQQAAQTIARLLALVKH